MLVSRLTVVLYGGVHDTLHSFCAIPMVYLCSHRSGHDIAKDTNLLTLALSILCPRPNTRSCEDIHWVSIHTQRNIDTPCNSHTPILSQLLLHRVVVRTMRPLLIAVNILFFLDSVVCGGGGGSGGGHHARGMTGTDLLSQPSQTDSAESTTTTTTGITTGILNQRGGDTPPPTTATTTSSELIWQALCKNGVDTVGFLPCNKLNTLMRQKPPSMTVMDLTRESTGLGLLFGRSLAKKRSALIIQNTGIGNLVTELFTIQKLYQEALPIFLSWRGHYKEPIEAQRILGVKLPALLEAMDVEYKIIETKADLEDLQDDIQRVFESGILKFYLLSPQVWESSAADYHVMGQPRLPAMDISVSGYHGTPTQTRYQAIEVILNAVTDRDIVIPQIGFPAKEAYNAKDRSTNFYMLGALGSATEVGIGLALAKPDRHVYVLDGDGSFFFNPNQFLDLATFGPDNLTIIILDNGSWGSTGNQPTLSSNDQGSIHLSAMAQSVGITKMGMTDSPEELVQMLKTGNFQLIHYLILPGNNKQAVDIPFSAVEIKERFMKNIV